MSVNKHGYMFFFCCLFAITIPDVMWGDTLAVSKKHQVLKHLREVSDTTPQHLDMSTLNELSIGDAAYVCMELLVAESVAERVKVGALHGLQTLLPALPQDLRSDFTATLWELLQDYLIDESDQLTSAAGFASAGIEDNSGIRAALLGNLERNGSVITGMLVGLSAHGTEDDIDVILHYNAPAHQRFSIRAVMSIALRQGIDDIGSYIHFESQYREKLVDAVNEAVRLRVLEKTAHRGTLDDKTKTALEHLLGDTFNLGIFADPARFSQRILTEVELRAECAIAALGQIYSQGITYEKSNRNSTGPRIDESTDKRELKGIGVIP